MNLLTHEILDNGCCYSFSSKKNSKKIFFLDRDGVINLDKGYVHQISDLILLKKNIAIIKSLSKNFQFIVITNQSGIDRGLYDWTDYIKFTNFLYKKLLQEKIEILAFFASPHHKNFSNNQNVDEWRKPGIGAIKFLKDRYIFDVKKSYYVGDKLSDIEFASNAEFKGAFITKSDTLKIDIESIRTKYKKLHMLDTFSNIDIKTL